jgi:hypothetical protein
LYRYLDDVAKTSGKQALKWFRLAVSQGDARGQVGLGLLYAHGWGVPADDKKALKWYHKAADQGFWEAYYELGNVYAYGIGESPGPERTRDGRSIRYAFFLPEDDKEAVKWYRLAADQEHFLAADALANIYKDGGVGVTQDYVQAYAWFTIAGGWLKAGLQPGFRQHYLRAAADLAKQMTPEQIARGQELSKELSKKINAAK